MTDIHKPLKNKEKNRQRNILVALENLVIQIGDPLNCGEAEMQARASLMAGNIHNIVYGRNK